ncbi:LysR family transcriptional regulator [Mesorhizobium sp. M7A.F.Ca.US.006.01.1.1]|uniref:LysR family transcriptional regulator n=1 Tax=Mesorhizobium sp. M7A.F.Ca.US.006.01.1.1 TaxID=2496707 RepID=UPI000FCBEBB5|nr:LysR family transcriptional regulator [Mesorhizobium sp. M7A.F.Ca.US.006.01.1.1]RUZ69427.1 LysR family transcriptional regulator [Mesorhizobium sp. M7A.F.Ca.US.006.01.1.1]
MDELSSIRAFISVAESGSFSEAARKADSSVSTVARHIKALEDELGVRLLNRTTRQQSLTEAGQIFYGRAREIVQELNSAKRDAASFQQSVKGLLRVTLRISTGTTLIVPALPRFLENHPNLTIDVSLTDERLDLVANNIDVAVWLGHLEDSSFIAKRLSPSHRVVCGSPSYFRKHGIPESPSDLARHNCLVFKANYYGNTWKFVKGDNRVDIPVSGNLRSSSGSVLLSAALSGLGLVLLQEYMVRTALQLGTMQTVLTDYQVSPTEADTALFAVFPHSSGVSPKTRAFIDFLVDLFRAREATPNVPRSI